MFKYLLLATFLVTFTYQIYVSLEELDVVTFRDNVTVCIPDNEYLYFTSGKLYGRWSPKTQFGFIMYESEELYYTNDMRKLQYCSSGTNGVPQLKCVDGTAKCEPYAKKISHINCYNAGIKNNIINWQCEAEIDEYDPVVINIDNISCRKVYGLKTLKTVIDVNSCTLIYKINNDTTSRKKMLHTTSETDIQSVDFSLVHFCLFMIWVTSMLLAMAIYSDVKRNKSSDCNKINKKN